MPGPSGLDHEHTQAFERNTYGRRSGYGARMVPWPVLLCVLFGSQVMVVLLLVLGFALHRNRRRSKELLLAFMKSEVPLAIEV